MTADESMTSGAASLGAKSPARVSMEDGSARGASAAGAGQVSSVTVAAPATASSDPAKRRRSPEATADVVITLALLALFGWAYLETGDWSFRTALFPRLVTAASFGVCVLHLVQALARLRREPPHPPVAPTAEDVDVNEDDVEYVFQTAGARAWASAIAWIVGFFVALYIAGLFITAPLFSVLYLRFAGGRSWLMSAVYAVVLGVVLYVAFGVLLGVSVPPGLFLD